MPVQLTALACCSAMLIGTGAAQTAAVGSGRIDVLVTFAEAPVSGAAVCVGTSQDMNLYFAGRTDAQGRVSVSPIPSQPYVVTANTSTRTAQVSRVPSASISFVPITLALQSGSSPRCPTDIAAGPLRTIVGQVTAPSTALTPGYLTQVGRAEYCFGAVGMGCGQVPPGLPLAAACAAGICTINGGSWDHDTCCYANPGGYACAGGAGDAVGVGPGSSSSVCRPEWDKAVRLTTKGLSWTRSIDFSRANATGSVIHSLYCAPANALVPPGDAAKCCSRATRALSVTEQAVASLKSESLRACQ